MCLHEIIKQNKKLEFYWDEDVLENKTAGVENKKIKQAGMIQLDDTTNAASGDKPTSAILLPYLFHCCCCKCAIGLSNVSNNKAKIYESMTRAFHSLSLSSSPQSPATPPTSMHLQPIAGRRHRQRRVLAATGNEKQTTSIPTTRPSISCAPNFPRLGVNSFVPIVVDDNSASSSLSSADLLNRPLVVDGKASGSQLYFLYRSDA